MGTPAARSRTSRPTGVPRIPVADVDTATWYYQRFLGFAPVHSDDSGTLVTGHGVAIRLAPSPEGPPAPQPPTVLFVDRPAVLRRHLDDLGAHLVDDAMTRRWPAAFGVRDCYGNVVDFCPTGGVGAVRGAICDRLDRTGRAVSRLVAEHRHRREIDRLREFLDDRGGPPGTFFVHAHRGQLHWLATTIGRLPAEIDVVVLGSDLTADEQDWARDRLRRPLHTVADRLDDSGALELVCAASPADFGWIELGCLVLDPAVLGALTRPPAGSSFACAWSYDSGTGFRVAAPYLLHVGTDALRAVRALDASATAGVHGWHRFNRQVEGRRCYSRVPTRRTRRLIGRVVPPGRDGRPRVPADLPFFEVTVVLQLLARLCGFDVHLARELSALGNARGHDVQDEFSDELVYIGALSYADPLEELSGYFHDDGVRLLYLLAERVVLAPLAATMPPEYRERAAALDRALTRLGHDPATAADTVVRHLVDTRGLGETAARRVVDVAATPTHPVDPTQEGN